MASSSAVAAAAAPRVAARARPRASSSSRASASAASTARRRASAAAAAPSAPSSELSWPDATATATCDGDLAVVASVVNLGARGVIATGLPFLDHMIDQLTSHAQLGVSVIVTEGATAREPCVDASGSDDERVASAAGEALGSALRAFLAPGIARTRDGTVAPDAASAVFAAPLDEAYSWCDLNASPETPGRLDFELTPYGPASSPGGIGRTRIGTYQTKLTEPFFAALTEASSIHIRIRIRATTLTVATTATATARSSATDADTAAGLVSDGTIAATAGSTIAIAGRRRGGTGASTTSFTGGVAAAAAAAATGSISRAPPRSPPRGRLPRRRLPARRRTKPGTSSKPSSCASSRSKKRSARNGSGWRGRQAPRRAPAATTPKRAASDPRPAA